MLDRAWAIAVLLDKEGRLGKDRRGWKDQLATMLKDAPEGDGPLVFAETSRGDALGGKGRYAEAAKRYAAAAERIRQYSAEIPVLKRAIPLWLAQACLLHLQAGEMADALRVGREAAGLVPDNATSRAKLAFAHALLLNNRYDEARTIYEKHKGKMLPGGHPWEDACREDFKSLREAGHDHPDMRKIERLLRTEPKKSDTKVIAARANQSFQLGTGAWRSTGILPVFCGHGQDARAT
jgi:tetratricopeptide (TPR) repeat protein